MVQDRDYFRLGFGELEIYRGEDKLCRACEGEVRQGDRVRIRETDDNNLNGLHHESCAEEVAVQCLEFQEEQQ